MQIKATRFLESTETERALEYIPSLINSSLEELNEFVGRIFFQARINEFFQEYRKMLLTDTRIEFFWKKKALHAWE